jgi:hypothetical protein
MTSNILPAPFVASASSAAGANLAYIAFNGSLANGWQTASSTTGWLQIDRGSAGSTALGSYAIASTSNAGFGSVCPSAFTLQGSNNGSTWTTLDTRTAETGWTASQVRTYTCNSPTGIPYRYYRLDVTASNGGASIVVGELYLYEATFTAQTITFATIAAKLTTDPPITLAATSTSGLAVSYSITGPATLAGSVVTLTGSVGSVTVTASQAGNGTYAAAANVVRSFAVTASVITERGCISYDQIRRADRSNDGSKFLMLLAGSGTPNGVITGSPGDIYVSTAGGANVTLWIKESGSATNTGWVAK